MKVVSERKEAKRARVTNHAQGRLVPRKAPSVGARLENEDEGRTYRVIFSPSDLPALEKIVEALKQRGE